MPWNYFSVLFCHLLIGTIKLRNHSLNSSKICKHRWKRDIIICLILFIDNDFYPGRYIDFFGIVKLNKTDAIWRQLIVSVVLDKKNCFNILLVL